MSQILSSDEIEDLMAGVEDGSIDLDEVESEIPSFEEVEEENVTAFFFGQKTAIRVGALPGLDLINDHLASQLSFKLAQKIGREVRVQPKSTVNQVFGNFLHSLESPIFINILRVDPSQAMTLLTLDGEVLYYILDGYFGGTGESEAPFRNFSLFEMGLINRIVEICREQIELSWRKLDPSFRFFLTRSENQPQFAAVMPLDDTVYLISFSLEVGGVEGTLTVCFPQVILELFKHQLRMGFQAEQQEMDSIWRKTLLDEVGRVTLRVDPIVTRFTMTMEEMMQLKTGDVLMLNTDMSEDFVIDVAHEPKMMGRAGVVRGKRAVRVTKFLEHL